MKLFQTIREYFSKINKNYDILTILDNGENNNSTINELLYIFDTNNFFDYHKKLYLDVVLNCCSELINGVVDNDKIIVRSNCFDIMILINELEKKGIIKYHDYIINLIKNKDINNLRIVDHIEEIEPYELCFTSDNSIEEIYDLLCDELKIIENRIDKLQFIRKIELISNYFPDTYRKKPFKFFNFDGIKNVFNDYAMDNLKSINLNNVTYDEIRLLYEKIISFEVRNPIELKDYLLNSLTPKEEQVILLRCGLEDNKCYTLEEIGNKFGLTRERIRQIAAKAFRRLKGNSRASTINSLKIALRLNSKFDYYITDEELKFYSLSLVFVSIIFGWGNEYLSDKVFWWEDGISKCIIDKISNMPDTMTLKEYDDIVYVICENLKIHNRFEIDNIINYVYKKIGNILSLHKINYRTIIKDVLMNYYPKGIYRYNNRIK